MAIWLLAGLALVVESIVMTWTWALCRAAALGDRRASGSTALAGAGRPFTAHREGGQRLGAARAV